MIAKMTDAAKQKKATTHLDMSKAEMKKGDMAACMKHMNEAHKAMAMKPPFSSDERWNCAFFRPVATRVAAGSLWAYGWHRGIDTKPMLTALRTGLRFRLAIMLAVFAAFCFVAPPAVLAFGHGAAMVDCMAHADMVDHGKVAAAPGMKHHGNHSAPAGNHPPSCCGLFCMSALVSVGRVHPAGRHQNPIFPPREINFFSRVPERLDRLRFPPRRLTR